MTRAILDTLVESGMSSASADELLRVSGLGSLPALVSGAGNGPIAVSLGAIGQSLPFGAVLTPDAAGVGQRTLYSAVSQGYIEGDYRNLAVAQHGSYITKLIQKLAPFARIFHQNGCLGSSSLIDHYAGVMDCGPSGTSGWQANRAWRGARASDFPNGDPGHKGEYILENGQWWECTTGNDWLFFYNSDTPKTVGGVAWRRQLTAADAARNTGRRSGDVGAKPTFPAGATPNVTTVTDNGTGSTGGGVVWTCRTPGANNNPDGSANGRQLRVMRTTDSGWDPMGALARVITAILGAPVNANNMYCLVIGTVQSDAGKDSSLIGKAMQMIGNAMANVGIKPIHTGCAWNPASTIGAYDLHETVLSGAGIGSPVNINASTLKLLYDSQSYVLGNPGVTGRTGALYYMLPSLYRTLGTDILPLLQTQPNPHFNDLGTEAASNAWLNEMRRILLNVAV